MAERQKISKTEPRHDQLHTPYKGGPTEFSGDVTAKRLVWKGDSDEVELLAVWFGAGARTRPHIHDVDQVLLIMEGTCASRDQKSNRADKS